MAANFLYPPQTYNLSLIKVMITAYYLYSYLPLRAMIKTWKSFMVLSLRKF